VTSWNAEAYINDLGLPERPRRERLNPVSQNVITILLGGIVKNHVHGEAVATLVQAMLLFGEEYVLTHTTEIRDRVIEDALACVHRDKFREALGGPDHDHDHCPYRGWTTRLPEGARAQP